MAGRLAGWFNAEVLFLLCAILGGHGTWHGHSTDKPHKKKTNKSNKHKKASCLKILSGAHQMNTSLLERTGKEHQLLYYYPLCCATIHAVHVMIQPFALFFTKNKLNRT